MLGTYLPTHQLMVPTICAWYLPTNQPMLPLPPVLGTFLPTYQWYLSPVLGTFLSTYHLCLVPSFLPTYLPTYQMYLPTNHLLGYVADTERGRERERDGLHFCTRRSFHGFFSQSCALNCSPVPRCCCSSRSLYVSVCMLLQVLLLLLLLLLPFVVVVLCTASHNHVLFFCLFSLRSSTNAAIAFIVCSILHQLRSW